MATRAHLVAALFLCLLLVSALAKPRSSRRPCKELVLYWHDVLYRGNNRGNATSMIVGHPAWGNYTTMAQPYAFGDLMIFDDKLTLDSNFHGPEVGRAKGMYFYDQRSIYGVGLAFSFVFNSAEHKGTINFAGSDLMMNKTRDISVIGGTGDFFMARGIATFTTGSFEGDAYIDIKLYECW